MTPPDAPTDAAPKDAAEEEPPEGASRWVAAATEIRGSVKWLVGGLGSALALVFGAGPLINNETDASEWPPL